MDIHICNFRSIKEKKISFTKGVTLLKGKSGAGKSTIFEAIRWCMYGSLKGITPIGEKNQTKVTIDLKTIKITRSNQPEKLIVEYGSKIYEKDEASGIIEKIYGSKNIWNSSSYLAQDDRNLFFKFTNFDKIDLIKEMI